MTYNPTTDAAAPGRPAALTIPYVQFPYGGAETNAPRIYWGTGSPEGVVTAAVGRLYIDLATGNQWRKASGAGNTGWSSNGLDTPLHNPVPLRGTIHYDAAGDVAGGTNVAQEISLTQSAATIRVQGALVTWTKTTFAAGTGSAHAFGLEGIVQHAGAGTQSEARAVRGVVWNSAAGLLQEAKALVAESAINDGGGTITTAYGLFVDDQTVGGTNYAIYTKAGLIRFGGNIVFTATEFDIGADTADGSDTKALSLTGGGNDVVGRGAVVKILGNECTTSTPTVPGGIGLFAGDVADAAIDFFSYVGAAETHHLRIKRGTPGILTPAIDELVAGGGLTLSAGPGTRISLIVEAAVPKLGFFNATPAAKPTVVGSKGGNAALANLLGGLVSLGLIIDSTT